MSALSVIYKCRGPSKQTPDKSNTTLTMETRFNDDQSMTTGTTIIECINDTRFSSIRETRQLKDQTVDATTIHNDNQTNPEQLYAIIDSLVQQSDQLNNYLQLSKKQRKRDQSNFMNEHQIFFTEIIAKLRTTALQSKPPAKSIPHSSTPYRCNTDIRRSRFSIGSPLAHSGRRQWPLRCNINWILDRFRVKKKLFLSHFIIIILFILFFYVWYKILCIDEKTLFFFITVHGTELNRTYLENNKTDWSMADISTWLHIKSQCQTTTTSEFPNQSIVSTPTS